MCSLLGGGHGILDGLKELLFIQGLLQDRAAGFGQLRRGIPGDEKDGGFRALVVLEEFQDVEAGHLAGQVAVQDDEIVADGKQLADGRFAAVDDLGLNADRGKQLGFEIRYRPIVLNHQRLGHSSPFHPISQTSSLSIYRIRWG